MKKKNRRPTVTPTTLSAAPHHCPACGRDLTVMPLHTPPTTCEDCRILTIIEVRETFIRPFVESLGRKWDADHPDGCPPYAVDTRPAPKE